MASILLIFSSVLLPYPKVLAKAQGAKDASVEALPSFAEPAISPDRSEVAFVSGGDIWTVPVIGGEARLLVSHPANESRPMYSPDGRRLAFVSNRTGRGDIYLLTLETGELQRLTFGDNEEQLNGWSHDGKWIYFHATSYDLSDLNDILRVSSAGGTPLPVTAERYVNEFFSAPSPDGSTLAFTAHGYSDVEWWRKGHSHLDESEIWLRHEGAAASYERVTGGDAKEGWPMWSADGKNLFYVSDKSGAQNIWAKALQGAARQVTQFKDGRVLWPVISYDGRLIVFERNFGIWKFDTANHQASEIKITRRGVSTGTSVEHLTLTNQFQELALSPDGKKVAFIGRGEIFAASAKDGGEATRITNTPALESNVSWSPDSKRLVYVSERDNTPHIYLYDFTKNAETQLTNDAKADTAPRFSPDGKWLAFERGARELRVMEVESKQERVVATGFLELPPFNAERPLVWSPDGKWLAFMSAGERAFTNIHIASLAEANSKPVSFLANVNSNDLSWSPDGNFLLFDTGQRTEGSQLARVDLTPRTPKFREDQFTDLFKDPAPSDAPSKPTTPSDAPSKPTTPSDAPSKLAAPETQTAKAPADEKKPAPKNVEVVFDGIRQRLSLLPLGIDADSHSLSPDGATLLFVASVAGQVNFYTYSLDELSREPAVARQLTSTAGFKSQGQFSPDGKEVFYLEEGQINVVNLETRQTRPLAVTAEMEVDFAQEKMEVFKQAWSLMRDHFYDANYHGVNWEAVRQEYAPRLAGARSREEMRRLLDLMVGELNASHLGISAPTGSPQSAPVGRLGLRFDRNEYENHGRLRVTEVIALSPAAIANIKVGEYLTAVDGKKIAARSNLDELLEYKVNRRVTLAIAASAEGANLREVAVRPITLRIEKRLLYRSWVAASRAYVEKASGGKLGYVHIPDMSSRSLAQLYVDLDAENQSREGVVIDLRNNNGGFVNSYALDVFARRGYITMTSRGSKPSPMRTLNGQRALELPTILLVNQHSLSDAEDFTEGYRLLKLGKVVGEPTSGWIIYTWDISLLDGSGFRVPRTKITDSTGADMELNPRPVDIAVSRPLGETYTGKDSQLDVAVSELLKQIGSKK
ncbi:MAG: PD40 domain-containing protein [Acidobacteria bacterium]|nr:PD40 domain-containing protein [Acidobacteriota bacterium]